VHALGRIHHALKPGGELIDVHPIRPSTVALAEGRELGKFDDREFFELVDTTEQGLTLLVEEGLFAPEDEVGFDWLERFDSAEDMLEDVSTWDGLEIPGLLRKAIEAARPPIDVGERVVLRRYRALHEPRK
jgi:hypothetical protein